MVVQPAFLLAQITIDNPWGGGDNLTSLGE
jgi:hypothetical protein